MERPLPIPASDIPLRARQRDALPFLTADVTGQIEDALQRVGEFGEVRLVVAKGRLRFIQVLCSESISEG